jgi:hypothetical protein
MRRTPKIIRICNRILKRVSLGARIGGGRKRCGIYETRFDVTNDKKERRKHYRFRANSEGDLSDLILLDSPISISNASSVK